MEQRLIDANAYAAELWKLRWNYQMLDDTHTADKIMHGIFRAEQALKEQPTVDAVPVVRCKDCRWACLAPQRQTATCMKKRLPFTHDYDYFCADGERRSDGNKT